MCDFFSFVGDGFGNYHCIGWETRQKWIKAGKDTSADSHSEILTLAEIPPKMQDRWDKYEYNPLTKKFTVDQGIEGHDHEAARAWVERLDFKKIIEPFVIKPIVNPLLLPLTTPTQADIDDLELWASVRGSVLASVEDSVGDSVLASVGDSVLASVRASVWASVLASVGASVWDSFGGYISSFFAIKYKYDFTPCIRLWERGLVPSSDGKTWRLHSGPKAEIVYEMKI